MPSSRRDPLRDDHFARFGRLVDLNDMGGDHPVGFPLRVGHLEVHFGRKLDAVSYLLNVLLHPELFAGGQDDHGIHICHRASLSRVGTNGD